MKANFKKLFLFERVEQIEATKRIVNLDKYERRYNMIMLMFGRLFEVLLSARGIIESSGYIPGSEFPINKRSKEALAQILQNTAMFGEILLRLPDITHRIIDHETHKEWLALIKWSIGFSQSSLLFDSKTNEMMELVTQELGIKDKDPNYYNPYAEENKIKQKLDGFKFKDSKPIKKRKKVKKGPKLSGNVEL
ncbi:CCDC134 (predicted) [Pycnogonum litorale]